MTDSPGATERQDFDSPWKEILECYFQEFITFFFPEIAEETDWERGYLFLDKEFQQVTRDAELGRRYADKLVRLWRKNGDEAWVLVHVVVQGQEEKKVRYVTSVERIGFKRGVSEGRQQGVAEGRQQGVLEGLLEGTLEAIEMGLSVKFGVKGLRLLPEIRRIRDIERLNMIKQIIRVTDDLAEVEASLDSSQSG